MFSRTKTVKTKKKSIHSTRKSRTPTKTKKKKSLKSQTPKRLTPTLPKSTMNISVFQELNKHMKELLPYSYTSVQTPPSIPLQKALENMRMYAKGLLVPELESQIYKHCNLPFLLPGKHDVIDGLDLDKKTNTQENWRMVQFIKSLCLAFDVNLILQPKF